MSTQIADKQMPFMKLRQVMDVVPMSRATIYRMVADGTFPKPKQIGERSIAWSRKEVED